MATEEDFVDLPGDFYAYNIVWFLFPFSENGIFKWRKDKLLPLTKIMISVHTKYSHLNYFILTHKY